MCLSGLININLSDHHATFIVRKKQREEKKPKRFEGRDYSRVSNDNVVALLDGCDSPTDFSDPDKAWEAMEENYLKVADELCPKKLFKIPNDRPEYFTVEISRGISKRDYLFLKARCCVNKSKARRLWREAIAKRREVRFLLRHAKRKYITREFWENKNNPKKYWRSMSRFLNRSKSKGQITEIVTGSNEKVSGLAAAEMINNFFCDVGKNLAKEITPTDRSFEVTETDRVFDWDFSITEGEVIKEVVKLDPNKSSGIPQLGNKLLKVILHQDAENFVRLLNSCIVQGIFPKKWKGAIVVPIPKGDKVKTLGNIRPISLLPSPSKIFERLIYNRL